MRSESASRSRASVVENTFKPVNVGRGLSTTSKVPGQARPRKNVDGRLQDLEGHRDALPAADAGAAEAEACPAPAQLVEEVHGDAGAARGERVADRDGPAVDVRLVARQPELLLDRQVLRREGLVHLEEVEVRELRLGAGERVLEGRHRPDA